MTDTCGCCEPGAPATPLAVENRPGLSALAYRIGTYSSFREAMLESIAATPELAALTARASDDYSITLLELWAAVGDVLTFYQERYANEAYLRTATRRESVGRLARLIDYELGPGAAAVTALAFTVDAGKTLQVPVGLRVQSVPGQDEQPQTFETLEAVAADSRWNRLRVLPRPVAANPLAPGSTEGLLAPGPDGLAAAASLAPRDRVLLFSTGSGATVEELEVRALRVEDDRVVLVFARPVQGTAWTPETQAYELGRTFRLFGHNAPPTSMTAAPDPTLYGGIGWSFATTSYRYPAGTAFSTSTLLLDARHEKLSPGVLLLVDSGAGTTLVTVTAVGQGQGQLGGVSDTVTQLTVTPSVPAIADRRLARVHELVGPPVRFWGYRYPPELTGSTVYLPGRPVDAQTIEVGRTIVRNAYVPGARVALQEIETGRRVLLVDDSGMPVAAKIAGAALAGAGVTVGPTPADSTTAAALKLDPASAQAVTGLVSAPLAFTVKLTAAAPQLAVTIGGVGPRIVSLPLQTLTVGSVATLLQAALAAADPDPGFAAAQVLVVDGRLLVVPGKAGASVAVTPTAAETTTAGELGLDAAGGQAAPALLSGALATVPALGASAQVGVTIGLVGPKVVSAAGLAPTVDRLAALLEGRIRAADPTPAFAQARVVAAGSRLLVLQGPLGAAIEEFLALDLVPEAPLDLDARSAVLLGNVARASHGETVKGEVVGNGDASAAFQRLPLRKKPLTYVPPTGAALRVLVDGVRWSEVSALYGQPPDARVYELRTGDDGSTSLLFGDGRTGAPLPTGRGNVQATYRVGVGVAGRARAGQLTTALDRPQGLSSVTNPVPATGGADPQAIENARENAPETVRTFGRAVSLRDFEDLVRASGEVAKAQATRVWDGYERAVHLTLAAQEGAALDAPALARLGAALTAARDPNHRLLLADFSPIPILLSATLLVDAAYVRATVLAAARAALLASLAFDALRLGEPLHLSDVYHRLQDVEGVVSADVDVFQLERPADRTRPNTALLPDGSPDPLQPHLRIYPARPDPTRPGAVLPAELAVVESPSQDVSLAASGGLDS